MKSDIRVGFEVLTAVAMKSSVLGDITPHIPLKVNWRFGGICRLHLQGKRISQEKNQREAGSKQSFTLLPTSSSFRASVIWRLNVAIH
jgi:hypothetical protein